MGSRELTRSACERGLLAGVSCERAVMVTSKRFANDDHGILLLLHRFTRDGVAREYRTAHIVEFRNGLIAKWVEDPGSIREFEEAWGRPRATRAEGCRVLPLMRSYLERKRGEPVRVSGFSQPEPSARHRIPDGASGSRWTGWLRRTFTQRGGSPVGLGPL